MCTHNHVLEQKKKHLIFFLSENQHFYSRGILLYITWGVCVMVPMFSIPVCLTSQLQKPGCQNFQQYNGQPFDGQFLFKRYFLWYAGP